LGIAGCAGLSVAIPRVSVGTFLASSAAGGVLARTIGDRHAQHIARAGRIEIDLALAAASTAAATDVPTPSRRRRFTRS
jgi:hypothetical protein